MTTAYRNHKTRLPKRVQAVVISIQILTFWLVRLVQTQFMPQTVLACMCVCFFYFPQQNVKKCRLAQGFCTIRDIFVVENGHLYYYIIALLILCGVEAKIFKNKSYILLSKTCSSLLKPRLSFKGFFQSQQLLI